MNGNSGNHVPAVLIVTAVQAECDAIYSGLSDGDGTSPLINGNGTVEQPYRLLRHGILYHILAGGVGPVAASCATMQALMKYQFELVISSGIAGGFRIPNRSVVLSTEVIAADLGIEDESGFVSLDDLGLGSTIVPTEMPWAMWWKKRMEMLGAEVHLGPVLTVSTVTGTELSAQRLQSRVPQAIAEDMEGFGVCFSAYAMGAPSVVIRSVSNPVGPREREKWEIQEALARLSDAFVVLSDVLGNTGKARDDA